MNRSEFWASVAVGNTGECWSWQRATHPRSGHGRARWFGVVMGAHRIAWLTSRGPIPVGLFVCHKCDNPPCCNPDHLYLGTAADNARDAVERGQAARMGPAGAANRHAKLTAEAVAAIRASEAKPAVLAERYGVTAQTIYRVRRGATWAAA